MTELKSKSEMPQGFEPYLAESWVKNLLSSCNPLKVEFAYIENGGTTMRKKALLIFIVIALFVTGLFLSKAFAVSLPWQLAPNNQPKYYWYNSPRNDGWNNAYRDWWFW